MSAAVKNGPVLPAGWFLTGCVGTEGPPRQIAIATVPFRVGRRPDANLNLPSERVSKLHAEIGVAGDVLFVRDLN
ncbi:MAG: FHA domain-containing protein, partial [Planctomycetaceae bacterium]